MADSRDFQDKIEPTYYRVEVESRQTGKVIECDFFDIARALNLDILQFSAMKYLRTKGDILKQINDTEKAIQCLKYYIEVLERKKEKEGNKKFILNT